MKRASGSTTVAYRMSGCLGALMREVVDAVLAQQESIDAQWEALLQRWAATTVTAGARTWRRQDVYSDPLESAATEGCGELLEG